MLLGTQHYGYEVDCWSAGCVIAEMATSRPLFPGDSEVDTLFKRLGRAVEVRIRLSNGLGPGDVRIFRTFGTPSEMHWPEATHLRHWKDRLRVHFRRLFVEMS